MSSSTPNPEKKTFQEPPRTPPVKIKSLDSVSIEETKVQPAKRPHSSNFNVTMPTPKKEVDLAINSHLSQTNNASSIVKASIRSQEGDNLQQRLQARKRASSLKPQKSTEKENKANKLEMYQKEIEEIMEKYAEDKIFRVQMIERKFRNDEAAGGSREERDAMMRKEIEEAQLEIVRERKEKIAFLRHKYET